MKLALPTLGEAVVIVAVAALGMKYVIPQVRKLPVLGQVF